MTRYVVIGSSGGNGTTNATSGANAAYASLSAWEDAEDGPTSPSEAHTVLCSTSNGNADTTGVTLNGWTNNSATNYIEIKAASTDKAGTSWSTSKYRLQPTAASAITVSQDYVRIIDLQIGVTGNTANFQTPITFGSQTASNEIWIGGCLIKQGGTANREPCIYFPTDTDTVCHIFNTICFGAGSSTHVNSSAITVLAATTVNVYNCTLIGGTYGINRVGGTVTLRNTYCSGVTAGATGTITATYSAFSDATGIAGTGNLTSVTKSTSAGAYFTNVTGGSEDWAIASTASSLDNAGDDVSGGSAPLNYTVDILGTTRSTYDIGAHEYVAAGGGRAGLILHSRALAGLTRGGLVN